MRGHSIARKTAINDIATAQLYMSLSDAGAMASTHSMTSRRGSADDTGDAPLQFDCLPNRNRSPWLLVRVVLVTGARDWPDDHLVWGVLSEQLQEHGPFVLVHGGLPAGVDALAHEWLSIEDPACDLPCCDPENLRLMQQLEEIYPVDLRTDGIAGITPRNQRMVDRGADVCWPSSARAHADLLTA